MSVLSEIRLEILNEADLPTNVGTKKKILSLNLTSEGGQIMKQGLTFIENGDSAEEVAAKLRFAASTILKQAKMMNGEAPHGKEGQISRSTGSGRQTAGNEGQVLTPKGKF